MGVKNRERRRAKQKERRQRMRVRGSGEPPAMDWLPPPADPGELLDHAVHARVCPDHSDEERRDYQDTLARRSHRQVSQLVVTRLEEAVTHAWRHGWQPADLARVAGRRAGAAAARMTADAIAAEMRRYSAATVDRRWAGQLTELGAVPWWDRDDGYLAARGDREGLAGPAVIGCAIDVLVLLGQLPVLPRLCPLPGTVQSRPVDHREVPVEQRVLGRVQALLAKAESTSFPEEAEAYTAKAQELIARHSIDQALLAAAEPAGRAEPVGIRLGVDSPYEQSKALLLDSVARSNRCRAVWHKELGFSSVVGFPTDLDAVELLYTSLLVQATAAMLREGSKQDGAGRSRTRSFRQSFLTAYATRIGERLRTATDQATQEAASDTGRTDLLPVLAAREHEVDEVVAELFPGLVSHGVRASDREGWASGRAAADRASLNVRERLGART